MDTINSRVVRPSDVDVEAELALHSSVFVTPEDAKRLAINKPLCLPPPPPLPAPTRCLVAPPGFVLREACANVA
jgi:hypothetical protein